VEEEVSRDLLASADRGSIENEALLRLDVSLERLESLLPSALIAPESLPGLRKVANLFPTFAVDFFGFECRLGNGGPGLADCALNLTPDGARLLAGRYPTSLPSLAGEGQNGSWSRLRTFYQEWGDTRQPPYADAGCTWLEFDTSAGAPTPNLLFGYWPRQADSRRPPEWLADTILPLLLGGPVSPWLRHNLLHCLEARPPETDDFQVGFMLSRPLQVVRLCLFDLPAGEIVPYLERIGWSGSYEELGRCLETFRPHADFLGLHLDIGETVYPQIGIEPNYVAGCWTRQPQTEPRWHGLFEELLRLGLMTPEQRQALLGWTGHQRMLLGGHDILLLRGLSHVKVVLRPGAGPVAKVYFGISHRWMDATSGDAS
jgi:hypothetical protein